MSAANQNTAEEIRKLEEEVAELKERLADLEEEYAEAIESKDGEILYQVSAYAHLEIQHADRVQAYEKQLYDLCEEHAQEKTVLQRRLWESYATSLVTIAETVYVLDSLKTYAIPSLLITLREFCTAQDYGLIPRLREHLQYDFDSELGGLMDESVLYLMAGRLPDWYDHSVMQNWREDLRPSSEYTERLRQMLAVNCD